jgi:hypothetical protein
MAGDKFWCPRRAEHNRSGDERDEWLTNRWDSKGATWPDGFDKPRTCSWCGGVHPGDAIALLGNGFRLEETDNEYKFYMHAIDGTFAIPPIKLYLMHFSEREVARADAVIRAAAELVAVNPQTTQPN